MRIADELREYAAHVIERGDYMAGLTFDLDRIADRIDAEYQKVIRELNDLADTSMLLPVDANGMPINVGDWITGKWDAKAKVVAVTPDDVYWWEPDGCHWCHAFEVRHYHKPTVEDTLREMAVDWDCAADGEDKEAVLKEYAAKLSLADDGKEQ